MSEQELGLYKEIPGGLRKGRSTADDWRKAKETMYYEWWRCLNASKEYLECCDKKGKNHELADTYALFGDVTISWANWWNKIGKRIFSERRQYPKVRAIEQEEALKKLEVEAEDFLILDIPLNLRRVTILEQINKLLDEHHDGKNLDVRVQSTALVQLETTKLQHKTIPVLVDVAEILFRTPDIQLYQLAQRAKLAEIHLGRKVQETNSPEQEKQRRQMAASRYKEQAERLVYNAARLKFPSIE
ncbi:hypothetical protein [Polynucleobacter sphagniphilus]|uniref:hypothetical protein n=1 Tax=Polynucleobacter sphagniphilus TaxID=1743169 RepID=UPI002474035A|nr:hypothetical protein [Polynucleobacter sphagniphilus]MDH6300132.1 hypothetical protein [Polynucleobacter sphagniphilus]